LVKELFGEVAELLAESLISLEYMVDDQSTRCSGVRKVIDIMDWI